MRVFLTGGTGMIGRRLVRRLLGRGDFPVILSRKAEETRRDPNFQGIQVVQGDPSKDGPWRESVNGADAVINLAGHNVFSGRWNAEVKARIRDSRVYGTEHLVKAIAESSHRPKVLVQGSAIGYYGFHNDEELTETSPSGSDFLAVVTREHEEIARQVESSGVRLATVRTGIVLAKGEGALAVMTPVFKWLPGGAAPVGNGGHPFRPATGRQWMSWIHIDDILGIFLLALDNTDASGPINGVAPNPARNVDFSRALARAVHRPFLPIGPPDLLIETVLGEMGKVVTKGQKVLPKRALGLGYRFLHPDLDETFRDLFEGHSAQQSPEVSASIAR